MGKNVLLVLPLLPEQVERDWLAVLVGIWGRQRLHYGGIEKGTDKVLVCLVVSESVGVVYQPVHDIPVRECSLCHAIVLDVDENFLDYGIRENVVLVVANEKLRIDREYVHETLNPLGEKVIGIF